MEDREQQMQVALKAKDWERAGRLALRYSLEDEALGLRETAQVWTRLGVECWAQTQLARIINERRGWK